MKYEKVYDMKSSYLQFRRYETWVLDGMFQKLVEKPSLKVDVEKNIEDKHDLETRKMQQIQRQIHPV